LHTSPGIDHTLTLPDGRKLGYRTRGNPHSPLVIYLGGLISSRLEIDYYRDDRFYLVGVDRPGYGNSDINPIQTPESFAHDIEHLVHSLGKTSCSIFGVSGGGSYGIGVASAKPHLVKKVGAFASISPFRTVDTDGCYVDKFPFFIKYPWYTRLFIAITCLQYALPAPLIRYLMGWLPSTTELDMETMDEHFIRVMTASFREAMKRGVGGLINDLRFYVHKWGADLHKHATAPILVLHGNRDTTTPLACSKWHAKTLPNCKSIYYNGLGHLHLPILLKGEVFNWLALAT
jgi:pimeloyl-ACP methyl ester carboxylesterase